MREYPVQQYYPSARVRFIVRLEDFGAKDLPPPPKIPPHLRKKDKRGADDLKVVMVDGAQVLVGPGDDPGRTGGPQEQTHSSDNRTFVIDKVIPLNATHQRNGARTADTLTVTVCQADFPFDPRAFRSIAMIYFFGCVDAEDYRRGIAGEVRPDATPSGGIPRNVVPDTFIDSAGRTRSNARFLGWVDDWKGSWSNADGPVTTFECTDNTRLFLNQDAPPKLTVDATKPIDEAVAAYLAKFPQFRGMSVEYRPHVARDKVPKLKEVLAKTSFQPKLGPPTGGAGGDSSKLKVWDYLTDVCGAIGHIIRVDGTSVVIQRPRTLYDGRFSGRPEDPFARGRQLPTGKVLTRRLMIYGKNIKSMEWGRQYNSDVAPGNVEVRSYDVRHKSLVVARFPEKNDRLTRPHPGNANEQAWHVHEIEGVFDKKTMKLFAQAIYEMQFRGENSVSLETTVLASYGGDNSDPDLLDLEPGDAMDVVIMREQDGDPHVTATDIVAHTANDPEQFLVQLGYSQELASAYAKVMSGIAMQTTFRTKTSSTTWEKDEGASVKCTFINYLELQADKDVSPEDQLTPADVVGADAAGPPLQVNVQDY